MKSFEGIKIGDRLVLRHGSKAEQIGVVASFTKEGNARVHKWLMRSQRWTDRVTIWPQEVKRFAVASDFKARRVKSGAPIGKVRP